MLYVIDLPYAYFGIIIYNNIVKHAAPIGHWMIGHTIAFVEAWVAKKGGTCRII